jgi:hypothetical protein
VLLGSLEERSVAAGNGERDLMVLAAAAAAAVAARQIDRWLYAAAAAGRSAAGGAWRPAFVGLFAGERAVGAVDFVLLQTPA